MLLRQVAVLDDYHHVFERDPSIEHLRRRVPVTVFEHRLPSVEALREFPILIALRERTRFDEAFFSALAGLELIAQTGGHGYHLDLDAATRAGVLVALAPSGGGASTVELAIGLMIAALRCIPQADRAVRAGEWPLVLGRTLRGKRLGILGLGRVGGGVAQAALSFGMDVCAWGPTLDEARASAAGVRYLQLDDVLEQADVVSIHLALSDRSRGLIDERRLRLIGPQGLLVNTSRGAIVDETALARVLEEGALGGAALDVFTQEPLPAASPLARLDNVVLTSHLGWPADTTYASMAENAVRAIEAYLDGRLTTAINPEALQHRQRPG